MSPLRSSAGPATWRMPTPSSLRTICASEVLPRPGRPGEQHVVERLAARLRRLERDRELLLDALLPDEVGERARAQRALELLLGVARAPARGTGSRHAAFRSAARTCSSTGSSSSTSGERALGVERATSRARRARRARVASPAAGRRRRRRGAELLLQLEHDALRGLAADAGDRLEARVVVAHDRAAQLGRRRPGDDRERDLRPDAADTPSSSSNSSRSSAVAKP